MRRIAVFALALTMAVSLSACRAKKAFDEAAIAKDLDNKGTIDLMKEADKDQYTPPADGRLTDKQIQMYLKVREHEKDIAKVAKKELEEHAKASDAKGGDKSLAGMFEGMKGLGSVADLLTADIRAAKDLGYNTKEYQWVKEQVLAASGYQMTQKLQQATSGMLDSQIAAMKKQYDEAKDEQSKKALGDMIAQMEKGRSEQQTSAEKADPAVEYNLQILSKYDNALNALTAEMSKFENKEGEAQKGMQDFQQNLDKAQADAKKAQ